MCSVYGGFGALSFCYDFDESSGATLLDGSGAGHNGAISGRGVTYHAAALTTNSAYAEATDGETGSMTSGVNPAAGSFSSSFFVKLKANANNYPRLASTGDPLHTSPDSGWYIVADAESSNAVYASMGYGTGNVSFGYIPLALGTSANVTLTYSATSKVATLCVGSSSPACASQTLPDAYVSSGNPLVYGGGSQYAAASESVDEAGFWQGTVLSSSQISTIAAYAGTAVAPTPAPSPSPTPTTKPDAMCSLYGGYATLSFCYAFAEASGTTLLDYSRAARNGTISGLGVAYRTTGLTTNSASAERTDGTSGSMTSGFDPTSGSFSLSFFVDLLANADNFAQLASTASAPLTSPAAGWYIALDAQSAKQVYASLGYGSGNISFGYVPLALNTPANVTLTYNANTKVATLCVGGKTPTCATQTLPAAYVASGNPINFGGGSQYAAANATFDEAGYWQGTVLTSSAISTIAGYVAPAVAPSPSPTPVATTTPALNDWPTYGYDAQRSGFNPNTAGISPRSIANGGLHLAWQVANNGAQTQPIVATNVGGHRALLIVGSYYSMYAYDAMTGATVWGPVALQKQNLNECGSSGVAGTPYYDAALGAVFVAAGNGSSPNHVILYELNAATGSIIKQTDVTSTLLVGESVSGHTAVTFANGLLYLGTASNCENASWRGRVVAVSPASMNLQHTFYTTYGVEGFDWGGGGVWAWGGVSADPSGYVYFGTGNAETPGTTNGTEAAPFVSTADEQAGYAEHLVKTTGDLANVIGSNYPGFRFSEGTTDLDYTGTPVLFQPKGCHLLSATQGKGGTLVFNDTTNLSNATSYQLSRPSGLADYMGNPGYSPNTGLLYAAVTAFGDGTLEPPGLIAFQFPSCTSSILWHSRFGPDSFSYESSGAAPRSAPTVTAGGVVFMGTPCTANGTGDCGTPAATNGALWAIDASTGNVLGGGKPVLITPDQMRMAPSADGLWLWAFDVSGNLYGLTVDPNVRAVTLRPGHHEAVHARFKL
jgi:hypothetical protein